MAFVTYIKQVHILLQIETYSLKADFKQCKLFIHLFFHWLLPLPVTFYVNLHMRK